MKKLLNGVQDVNFTADNGNTVDGVKLHYLTKNNNVFGLKAVSKFIKRDILMGWGITFDDLKELVNTEIDIEISDNGAICGITV